MSKTLILYSTTDGQTKKICEYIKLNLKHRSEIDVLRLDKHMELSNENFDEIIIGASIRYGKYQKDLFDFIKKNKSTLESKNNAFFSVNVVARKSEKSKPDTNPYMKKFLESVTWRPKSLAVFAGKIDYPKYRFIDKQMIRFIMYLTNGPTNIDETYEFTDWSEVKKFARSLDFHR